MLDFTDVTDFIYQEDPPQQDSPARRVTGRNLAHAHRSTVERALAAADLHVGRAVLVAPTVLQAASLLCVCRPYVTAACRIVDDQAARTAVLSGRVSLLDATKAGTGTLAEHFARSTPDEWLEAARVIGPAVIWDHMIAPLV
jgi:hypothetical protein